MIEATLNLGSHARRPAPAPAAGARLLLCLGMASAVAALGCAPTESNPRRDAAVDPQISGDGGTDIEIDERDGGSGRRDACSGEACTDAREPAPRVCEPACSADAPVCDDGECGACRSDADCSAIAGAPYCLDGACITCKQDADCADPLASFCDPSTNVCVSCTMAIDTRAANASCGHITAQNVCSESGCVQCTADDRSACGDDVCDANTHTCATGRAAASADPCDSCVSDAECKSGQLCVQLNVPASDPAELQGWFCQPIQTATALCRENQPYVREQALGSIDRPDITQAVCTLRVATCEASSRYSASCGRYGAAADAPVVFSINRYLDAASGGPGAVITPAAAAGDIRADDALCGAGGSCATVSQPAGVYSCTAPCQPGSNLDCPMGSVCQGAERTCSVD